MILKNKKQKQIKHDGEATDGIDNRCTKRK